MVSELRKQLITALSSYQSDYEEEMAFKPRFLELLQYENCFERSLLHGHITGSAWIVDTNREFAFMTHHAKLNKWLQPGGHCDGDEDVAWVALKEALEETGMPGLKLSSSHIFDIDIHPIPERKGVPAHEHYDIRYLIEVNKDTPFQLSEESHELAWLALDELWELTQRNVSIHRMVGKTRLMR